MKKNKGRFQKGNPPWNKGLTKETDERIEIATKRMTKTKKGQLSPKKGKEYTTKIYTNCLYCKKLIKSYPSQIKKFCSFKCHCMNGLSKESREKVSKSLKKQHKEGKRKKAYKNISNSMMGHITTEKTKKKLSATHQGIDIKDWKSFIFTNLYGITFTNNLRKLIRKRDNFRCIICLKKQNKVKHSIHHINYDKNNNNLNNLITLCNSCHCKTNYNRKYWEWQLKIYMNLFKLQEV